MFSSSPINAWNRLFHSHTVVLNVFLCRVRTKVIDDVLGTRMRIESRLLRARAHLPPPSKKSNKNNGNNYNNNSNCNNNNKEKQRGKCCCGYKTGFRCLLLCSEVWFYNRGVLIVDFLKALKIGGIYFCRNYIKCNSDH